MATATAKAGAGKGTGAKGRESAKRPKKTAKKAAKKRARKPPKKAGAGRKSNPKDSADHLALIQQKHPGITSDQYVSEYKLPLEEVARLRFFVSEYLKDWNIKGAALRMGYNEETAYETGSRFLYHSFSQLRIQEILATAEADAIVSTGQIVAGLWKEGNAPNQVQNGCVMSNSASRISALKELARIKGLGQQKSDPGEGRGFGGLFFVPIAATPEEWAKQAMESQKQLKASVIEKPVIDV